MKLFFERKSGIGLIHYWLNVKSYFEKNLIFDFWPRYMNEIHFCKL